MNQVNIIARLVKDPEIRQTNTGTIIMQLFLALNEKIKRGNEYVDKPIFIDATCFGDRYEKLAQYLHKGTQIGLNAKLDYSQWETSSGEKRSRVGLIANNITLLSAPKQLTGDPLKDTFGGETIRNINNNTDDDEFPF